MVVQNEPVNDKQSTDDHHLPNTIEIPPPSSPPEEDNSNDWSFSMEDSDLLFDELGSDQEDATKSNKNKGKEGNTAMAHPEKNVEKEGGTTIMPQWQIDHSDDIFHTNDSIIQHLHMTAPASNTVTSKASTPRIPKPSSIPNQRRRPSAANDSPLVQTRLLPVVTESSPALGQRSSPALVQTRLSFAETKPSSVPYQRELSPAVPEPSQITNQGPAIHQQCARNSRTPLIPQKRPAPLNSLSLSTSQRVKLKKPLIHTLNQTLTIDYTPRPSIRYDHLNIHEYLSNCSRNEHHHATTLTKVPLGPLTLYTQTLFDEQEQRRMVVEMGVYHTKELGIFYTDKQCILLITLDRLFVHLKSKDVTVICKKNLPRPVQIQLE
jgi:hypothetical protein